MKAKVSTTGKRQESQLREGNWRCFNLIEATPLVNQDSQCCLKKSQLWHSLIQRKVRDVHQAPRKATSSFSCSLFQHVAQQNILLWHEGKTFLTVPCKVQFVLAVTSSLFPRKEYRLAETWYIPWWLCSFTRIFQNAVAVLGKPSWVPFSTSSQTATLGVLLTCLR